MSKANAVKNMHRWCKKPGTVRPGQRTPYRKATAEEVQERIEFTADLILKEKPRCEIHRILKRKWGLHWTTIDSMYVLRARKWLMERCNITVAQAKSKGLNVLIDVLRTGNNSERLKAERRLAEVFGYDAPRKMEVTGRDGEPLVNERPFKSVPTEELIRLAHEESRGVIGAHEGNGDH
jgi:hypothetical protein